MTVQASTPPVAAAAVKRAGGRPWPIYRLSCTTWYSSAPSIVPVAGYSACEIAWHRWAPAVVVVIVVTAYQRAPSRHCKGVIIR